MIIVCVFLIVLIYFDKFIYVNSELFVWRMVRKNFFIFDLVLFFGLVLFNDGFIYLVIIYRIGLWMIV